MLRVCSRLGEGGVKVMGRVSKHGHIPPTPTGTQGRGEGGWRSRIPPSLELEGASILKAAFPPCQPTLSFSQAAHGLPKEGIADHFPGPALQGEGESLLRFRDLGCGLLCFKE